MRPGPVSAGSNHRVGNLLQTISSVNAPGWRFCAVPHITSPPAPVACFQAALLEAIYLLHALLPVGEPLLRFILGDAIRFLDLAGKVIAPARNHV